ncbi:MAG: hypothetical protein QOK15_3614, partial [Nocardioidaceae bacterium]|nr:hypothetical protein [Nocardioidaceae bacterium]
MGGSVTALLVSHDGGRWLPAALAALAGQTVTPDRVLAVDTGSVDDSADLLTRHLGEPPLVLPRATTYAEAVRAALATLAALPAGPDDWVWLLHDDSAPAPDALERLLAAGDADPALDALGPKVREWPSLRRLLEAGVTVSGTGRRETGLEPGEFDQGQHDTPRDVLAVNTAGMLVRRSVLQSLPLDPELPVVHTDLDLGWRMARTGHRVGVVPAAVLFHAEASRTGLRVPGDGRGQLRRRQRRAATYTLLVNCAAAGLVLVAVRQLLGGLLRALGLLLVRAPVEAAAEVTGVGSVLLRPGLVARARRQRRHERAAAPGPSIPVRPLLAPATTPYRRGIEELAAIGAAARTELGPRVAGPFRRPGPGGLVVLVLAVCAAVAAVSGGTGPGGALLPAPASAGGWWGDYLHTAHLVGTGSDRTAPAYLLPLALLGTLLLGSARLALDLLVVGAVPLAAVGALRFLRRVGAARTPAAWGAATYALALVTGGALHEGRVGTLAAAVLLPWLVTSGLGLLDTSGRAPADRRQRAAWRTALWLALAAAFAPQLWLGAALVLVLGAAALLVRGRGRMAWPLILPLPVSAVLLLPWSALAWRDRGPTALLVEAGWPARWLLEEPSRLGVLAGELSGTGIAWVGLLLPVLATLALLRRETRPSVLAAWAVALLALVMIRVLSAAPAATAVWPGVWTLVLVGAWTTAAAVAAPSGGGRADGRRLLAGLVAAAAVLVPVAGAAWWVTRADDAMPGRSTVTVPLYLDEAAQADPAQGTLVLTGTTRTGLVAELRRGGPSTLGQEALLPSGTEQGPVTDAVADLLAGGHPTAVARLGDA